VVGGTVVQLEPDEGRLLAGASVQLELEPPLMPVSGTLFSVRADRIERILATAHRGDSQSPPPGTVVLADGRRLMARAIRWRKSSLAVLTADGVVDAPFTDLTEVVFPSIDRTKAVIEDNQWASANAPTAIARFQTTSGAVITAARVIREQEQSRRRGRVANSALYYAQPAWADQPIAIPEQDIVCCGYRSADEAPLTAFPATTIANRRLIGSPEPWTINRTVDGGLLASRGMESDLGLATHAYSAIAFDLPPAAKTLQLALGLDRAVGDGGCVRCKVVADAHDKSNVLWNSGIIEGKDEAKWTDAINVAGVSRVQLVTEYAHDERPPGADPLDIRDAVVWLAPLVRLDLSSGGVANRALTVLPGAADWQLVGDAWRNVEISSRWNVPASSWDSVLALKKDATLTLQRKHRVTRASDVVQLLTTCPADLSEHDFSLAVNGTVVPWHNNADRNQLRQWTLRYSRTRARDGDEESNLTDRLAYWWDLSPWRSQEVTLELTIQGNRDRNEIAWRSLAIRSAIGNLPDSGQPISPDVPLSSIPSVRREGAEGGPVRLLGQSFSPGMALAKNGSVAFALKPEYRKFVAVVGCTVQVAGPVQVLIDDGVAWERAAISSLSPAEQIEIPLPAGAKTLTLQSGSEGLYYGTAAFVEAGFLVGQASGLP
ncbi:MAG: NPCBM/NEW2 domain-containing protein, partial [Planctomycetia bacterium]|nr:NPCBM/NEW2 domain-containing protein [Planctomycetia bacterium]